MITKLITQVLFVQLLLAMGCATGQQESIENTKMPLINYNGDALSLDEKTTSGFIQEIDLLFNGCDDFYELIVTDQVIETIKSEKRYIEILFPEKRTLEAGKFKKTEFDRILIPLSGKFHSSGQVTFFTGTKDYYNTPVLNSKGSILLDEALKEITK